MSKTFKSLQKEHKEEKKRRPQPKKAMKAFPKHKLRNAYLDVEEEDNY